MIKTLLAITGLIGGFVAWSTGCQSHRILEAHPELTSEAARAPGELALRTHPASQALARLFPSPAASALPLASGVDREDYLLLVAGNVDFYKRYQNAKGAIIDPVQGKEIQYSTPCFAMAAATLAVEKHRDDLLEPAVRAMTFATHALANHTTADFHADFYIPMLMHARRILKTRVSPAVLEDWDTAFRSIVPQTHYRDTDAHANWNIVQIDGETLRRQDGLVATSQASSQPAYIERSLDVQQKRFTRFGMYADPYSPMAYDAFPRMWLDDMLAGGAYTGTHAQQIRQFLLLGGLSSLLIISPTGEWAVGGRSAQHQWNEAENIVIFEINAAKWREMGRDDIAGAMKRSAHLAFQSMRRWQRPSGEMWIVKNHAEPPQRLGFEAYSSHSQYNLLPMAMLCIAYEHADDSIAERAAPCEVGGYVLDLREGFHKVFANAGGMYVEIDTAADPRYNATGLQRVQKTGVPFSPLSDTAASHRAYGPSGDKTMLALSPTIQWNSGPADSNATPRWRSLADYVQPIDPKPAAGEATVADVSLRAAEESADLVEFALTYSLSDPGRAFIENYRVSPAAISGNWRLTSPLPDTSRVVFPALINDGARTISPQINGAALTIERAGSRLQWEVTSPPSISLRLEGPKIATHNGYVQAVVGDLPQGASEVSWTLTLKQTPATVSR